MIQTKQRENYLSAMQINTWLPRAPLPFAKQSDNSSLTAIPEPPIIETIAVIEEQKTPTPIAAFKEKTLVEETPLQNNTPTTAPHFSLQLMQVGRCLLLIERPIAETFHIKDPAYQLLRNILYAAKLPDSPQPLGDLIQWPLFKHSTIAQGKKEAKEFLQSFIITYKEQFINTQCLWLIGLDSICHATDLNETNYFESPIIEPYGQILLSPSLDILTTSPHLKAPLWQAIRKLIPLWQN
ncbi:hypothetical protein DKL61_15050 [Gammaproteobacteria bacterium ESL0073]|nr:hypothetical protein DKL61_15050 [Gammaproteobacteria bacterium ESL0073]